ncbi:MAG: rod shape-determining protein [Candidatus Adiutrix sp.]|jgi:rod shape-determining protein MreB|nr:rod shape-determining protein [Candidatus Adiutrix sp.]
MSILPFSNGLAMDLGTANTLIYEKGRGIILDEPSAAALNSDTGQAIAVGRQAKSYLGRTPVGLEVIRPMQTGVISDFNAAQQMIRRFLRQARADRRVFKPKIIVGVPTWVTQVEKRTLVEAVEKAGAKSVYLVDEPLAAAVGLGLPIEDQAPSLVLDIGGGVSEGVIIANGVVAVSESRLAGGDEATEAVARFLRRKYQIAVGENMAERIKIAVGSAWPLEKRQIFSCSGKELTSGIPRRLEVDDADVREALAEVVQKLVGLVRQLLMRATPALTSELMKSGLYLTGGGSLLKGLSQRLAVETGLKVEVPENPRLSLVTGLARILENMRYYKKVFVD